MMPPPLPIPYNQAGLTTLRSRKPFERPIWEFFRTVDVTKLTILNAKTVGQTVPVNVINAITNQ